MRESCSCGASVRGSRRSVVDWRANHRHTAEDAPEPDKQGTTSQAELAYREPGRFDGERFIPEVQMRMGFTPNA